MKSRITLFLYLSILLTANGQDTLQKNDAPNMYAPFNLKWKVDVPLTVVGYGTNYLGLRALRNKKAASVDLANLDPDDVPFPIDRAAARQDPRKSKAASLASDISLVGCFLLPGVMLFDKRVRADGIEMIVMHMETQAIMANTYFVSMLFFKRKRPYVYNTNEDPGRRSRIGNNNSFYGGHAAHAASCSFFIAKVLSAYYPERKLGRILYPAALIPPAVVGYFRYRGGHHFPTDLVVGTAVGAAIGWIIPELHKPRKDKNKKKLDVGAMMGPDKGLILRYSL